MVLIKFWTRWRKWRIGFNCGNTHKFIPPFMFQSFKKSLTIGQVAYTILPTATNKVKLPECILARKMVKRGNRVTTKVLVQWQHCDPKATTWEFLFDLQAKYPNCILEDKDAAKGRVLMQGMEKQEERELGESVGTSH